MANAQWLPDFAFFMALRSGHSGAWQDWSPALVARDPAALAAERTRLADEIAYHAFLQFLFAQQWERLRAHAHASGVRLFGDIPIFVADDSADVWAHQRLFRLDRGGHPLVAAGVPPDYFSATGQLWGNPVYRWDVLAADGYAWWIERFRRTFELVDLARIDHFRGFESSWQVPAGETTAERGEWVPGPGLDFLSRVARALGALPIVAEDLGVITAEVHALRTAAGFPGMKVLQFAFGGDACEPFLPHNHEPDSVVYTGTHDNDTTRGWFAALAAEEQRRIWRYIGRRAGDPEIVDELIRLAYLSVAAMAIVPMQDVLALGSEARMNTPAVADGNWGWRLRWEDVAVERAAWLKELATTYGRWPAA
jgi:4-alpha-glucanotransferase